MYKIFEKIDINIYHLRYESSDLYTAIGILIAFKSKYEDRHFVLLQYIV